MVTLRCYVLNCRFLDNVTVIIFARCMEILATDKRRYIYIYVYVLTGLLVSRSTKSVRPIC